MARAESPRGRITESADIRSAQPNVAVPLVGIRNETGVRAYVDGACCGARHSCGDGRVRGRRFRRRGSRGHGRGCCRGHGSHGRLGDDLCHCGRWISWRWRPIRREADDCQSRCGTVSLDTEDGAEERRQDAHGQEHRADRRDGSLLASVMFSVRGSPDNSPLSAASMPDRGPGRVRLIKAPPSLPSRPPSTGDFPFCGWMAHVEGRLRANYSSTPRSA